MPDEHFITDDKTDEAITRRADVEGKKKGVWLNDTVQKELRGKHNKLDPIERFGMNLEKAKFQNAELKEENEKFAEGLGKAKAYQDALDTIPKFSEERIKLLDLLSNILLKATWEKSEKDKLLDEVQKIYELTEASVQRIAWGLKPFSSRLAETIEEEAEMVRSDYIEPEVWSEILHHSENPRYNGSSLSPNRLLSQCVHEHLAHLQFGMVLKGTIKNAVESYFVHKYREDSSSTNWDAEIRRNFSNEDYENFVDTAVSLHIEACKAKDQEERKRREQERANERQRLEQEANEVPNRNIVEVKQTTDLKDWK